ncbi:hypothetical protein QCA50_016627 [Cerrena zonata]|uniref:Zn(2)-C6 fungal-type domain-containing protein n=1 Tax=Cerrena zonata TaxID=2478898 RepID=A0AAW0FM50_9APHY
MPQSSRAARHADERERAKEQESKRNRGAISCAECRRLKLKCDKTVPCSSCTRRGCASICPNGSLTTGQGTRFILADTDRLHRKIVEMSDRIRQLEDALAILQASTGARDPHPLLSRDLLGIKSGIELHSASLAGGSTNVGADSSSDNSGTNPPANSENEMVLEVFGTLAVRDDGGARFFGSSAGQESLLLDADLEPISPTTLITEPLPELVERLNSSFPSGPSDSPLMDFEELIETYLPPWPRAAQLRDLYLEQAPWFFGAVTSRQLCDELLPMFYSEAEQKGLSSRAQTPPPPTPSTPSSSVTFQLPRKPEVKTISDNASPHDLALLFVVFCFGALTDPILPAAPHNTEASQYFDYTKAALNLVPILDGNPSVSTVQTLSLMGIYQGMVADENSIEITWAYMGLSCRLAQTVGLHRDSARWKLSPSEVQKRRALFWELFITDGFQSLATGRLPIFSLPFVDTQPAADPDEELGEDGTSIPSFPAWKARFGRECIAPIVQATTQARTPKYSVILELDRKIRDMELPKYATGQRPDGAGLSKTMSHYMPQNYRELALTYVHRCYFAQALTEFPQDPLRSSYAPSFLAGYRSACALLSSMREQFELFPIQLARFWVLWTHAFSATVMLASVVTHGGITKTAQAAMGELRLALDLFERTSKHGGRAVKFLPIIRRLHDKAYASINEGFKMQKDIFGAGEGEKRDELSIFGGRTHTVKSKVSKPIRKRSVSRRRISPAGQSPGTGAPSP